MERSGNFYKAIRLGYILISILIGYGYNYSKADLDRITADIRLQW
jgi:hypothetical protein